EESLRVLLLHQLRGSTAHQQRRDGNALRRRDQRLLDLVRTGADAAIACEKTRVPMPAPAAVRVQPQVFLQPLVGAWARPMRQIRRDCIRGLGNRAETLPRVRS